MLPVVHPGLAYLVYTGWTHLTSGRPPGGLATLALVGGALLPDLIDQPLYFLLPLPSTRTLAHSLLVAVPVTVVVVVAVRRSSLSNTVGNGFAIGYLSHPIADAFWPLLLGKHAELGFLLWPLTESPAYEGEKALFVVGDVTVTTWWPELGLLALATVVWWLDGKPGITAVVELLEGSQ
ncbi:putative membrane-bound metal-dependent hydrolase (DUF457) [Halalkaliarchaeum desulfuricum]|uniref:Putative membrane-bound metal-dependent hydrolase (DUF457) n=1 Tax=Halalkaliarchaeum desulfuricum TaxID=2055893 RepID=A0A343THM9_9EURY|nr:metal-dependent hydrolase [Halalkaliarchaeum desulfuricum]AUX08601.1 putative membrane-bound metal-dependent hydrolase (DUF457) [Halalkaliarchaeum desulfuricum]